MTANHCNWNPWAPPFRLDRHDIVHINCPPIQKTYILKLQAIVCGKRDTQVEIGDLGLGIRDWTYAFHIGSNPQSQIPIIMVFFKQNVPARL